MAVLHLTVAVDLFIFFSIVVINIIVIAMAIVVIIGTIVFSRSNNYAGNIAAQIQET